MTTKSLNRSSIAAGVIVAVLGTLVTGVSPAHAADHSTADASSPDLKVRQLSEAADEWDPASEAVTAWATEIWERRGSTTSSGREVEPSRARAYSTPDGIALRIPFADAAEILPESNLTVLFGSDGQAIGESELVLEEITSHSGRVQTWTNGVLRLDRVVDEADAQRAQRSSWWGRFTSCLNSKGVAAWAVTAITIACSAACIATVGAGCLVCLGAASAITSGTITYCVGKANQG